MIRKRPVSVTTVGSYTVVLALVGFCTAVAGLQDDPNDSNMCASMETVQELNNIVDFNLTTVELKGLCFLKYPLKCIKKIGKLIPKNIQKLGTKYIRKAKCCNGYELSLDGESCRPICKVPCIQGFCIKPNVCHCHKEFGGQFCNIQILCPEGTYGLNCIKTCQCLNNSTCNTVNGTCHCQPGYSGQYCENACSSDYYGINCVNKCDCPNGTICNPVNGSCSCPDGYTGDNCETPCLPGFYGQQCKLKCNCQYNQICDPVNGSCKCKIGYFGKYCWPINRFMDYTENIGKRCDCNWYRTEYCDPLTGQCKCKYLHEGVCHCRPGWTGYDCKTMCPFNTYGLNCNSTCTCQNGGICRSSDGVCLCQRGFYGPTCSEVCPRNYYGESCLHRCMCKTTAEICDPIRGCICGSNSTDNNCFTALKLEPENELSTVLNDISIVLCTLIISTILCAGILMCYYYCFRRPFQESDRLIRNNFQLRKSITPEVHRNNRSISIINGTVYDKHNYMRNHNMFNLNKPMSYMNEIFFVENDRVRLGHEPSENIYIEIGESTSKPTEDLYDRLDFLRPTGSWKPHYQCTGGSINPNTEKNITT